METLLNIAVSNAVGAALLAVIAAIVSRFCRRPVVRHALWLLVLLKLITPPLPISVVWPQTEQAELPSVESPAPDVDMSPLLEPIEADVSLPEAEETATPTANPPASPMTFADIGIPLVFALWLAGSLVWWTLAAVRLRKFQRWLRQARPASADVQEQARRLAVLLGVRRCPPVAFVSAPLSPLLWALGFSPRLLLPSDLWPRLGAEQQDTLLAHELAHLRRGDHWIRHLELLVLGLYWWYPVVWWARRRLQEAEEECCDALVLAVVPDAASAYAAALVETVAFLSQARAAVLVGASGAGQVPLLKRRLTMILTETSARKPSRLAFWIVLGLGALLLPLAPRAVRTEAPKEHAQKEPPRRENVKPQPAVAERDRSEEIEKLQDEIELLKVKVRLKETQLRTRKEISAEFRRRYEVQKETNRITPGAIGKDAMMETYIQMKTHELEGAEKEVELQESVVLLKQAERRLTRLRPPANSNEHKEARGFIDRVWPTLETSRLEDNIPKARKAFQICKDVGDRSSLQKLLKGTEGHADRLRKELQELKPNLIAEDVEPARKLQRVSKQILELSQEIGDYLKAHADDK